MARYSGIRRQERSNLNRVIQCFGDDGSVAPISFHYQGHRALACAFRHLRTESNRIDKRTRDGKRLVAAIQRLNILQQEIER